jgi:hypothetical protein
LEQLFEDDWHAVCELPCSSPQAPGIFRVSGAGVTESESFRLTEGKHSVTVDPGSSAARVTGTVLTPVGGATMLVGTFALFLSQVCTDACDNSPRVMPVAPGAALFFVGATVMTVGILLITSNRTKIAIDGNALASDDVRLGNGMTLGANGLTF